MHQTLGKWSSVLTRVGLRTVDDPDCAQEGELRLSYRLKSAGLDLFSTMSGRGPHRGVLRKPCGATVQRFFPSPLALATPPFSAVKYSKCRPGKHILKWRLTVVCEGKYKLVGIGVAGTNSQE
jgi:hypothetical protein